MLYMLCNKRKNIPTMLTNIQTHQKGKKSPVKNPIIGKTILIMLAPVKLINYNPYTVH